MCCVGRVLTGPICPSLFINPLLPRPTKTSTFIILLCLTPNHFTCQRRAFGWERVNNINKYIYKLELQYCNDLVNVNLGVVAYIEVRSNTENRSEGISKQMEMLGAKVMLLSTSLDIFNSCFYDPKTFRVKLLSN